MEACFSLIDGNGENCTPSFCVTYLTFDIPNVEMTDSVGNGHASFSVLIVFE